MVAAAAGSVWLVLLVLYPVAARLASDGCVTYQRTDTCGIVGSSVELACSYPKQPTISTSGWSTKPHPTMKVKPLKQMPAYSFRVKYLKSGSCNCTIQLADLKTSDASIYYFTYSFKNATGFHVTCKGLPGVSLHVFASPVGIMVQRLIRGTGVPVSDWKVKEGQSIRLTCVFTCAVKLNSNPGYIWYKNRLQLNGKNSAYLSLGPISYKDSGRYVCALTDYKNLPSSAVDLQVQRTPRNMLSCDSGSKVDSVPIVKRHCDVMQNSTGHVSNNGPAPTGRSMFTVSIMLIACVCVGLIIAITVTIVVFKKKRRRRRSAASVPMPPDPNAGYMALDITSTSAEYDTLDRGGRRSPVYENYGIEVHGVKNQQLTAC